VSALSALLRRSAELLDEQAWIVREIAVALDAPPEQPAIYSTAGTLPPGRSRRWFREHAREMGATRSGGARGRDVVWTIPRADYEAWLSRGVQMRDTVSRIEESRGAEKPAPVVNIDAWIAGARYRATRAAR
jgi:hypothetical protein